MLKLLVLGLLVMPLCGIADSVYRTTDENGNVVFTDNPPAGAGDSERVDIQPTNTLAPPPNRPESRTQPTQTEGSGYAIAITAPANDTSIPMGPGNFSVTASVSPQPGSSEHLQLLIDGEPRGIPQGSPTWNLTNVFRGEHSLTVAVVDLSGDIVAESDPVRVFVHRPSVNFNNRSPAGGRP